jgi:hypothetical protein
MTTTAPVAPPVDTAMVAAGSPRLARRLLVSVAAGLCCLLGVIAVTGLWGEPVGAGDNGDGSRLYCGAGLVARTPDQLANWKGGVVLDFGRSTACPDPVPSSALPILRAAAHGATDSWSLIRLGWTYALLAAATTAVAAWAATAGGLHRVLVLLPPVLPLLQTDFARFFVSTFSEPAGLLGALALLCGVGVVVATGRSHRVERLVGLALVAGGGLVAGTAKLGYAPLLGVAALLCAVTAVRLRRQWRRRSDRVVGPVVAVVVLLAAAGPVATALSWQATAYGPVNQHNLVYTVVLPEVEGSAAALGLPEAAAQHAGNAFYPNGTAGVAGAEVIAADPTAARNRAWRVLLEHPFDLVRVVGVGLQATQGRSLDYLPSQPYTADTVAPVLGTSVGAQGAEAAKLRGWLDAMAHPWWPSLVAVLGVAAGLLGLRWRSPLGAAFGRTAGVAAVSAVGLAVLAVLGDGYFEVAKHVWLAAFLLDVTLLALVGAAGTAAVSALRGTALGRRFRS